MHTKNKIEELLNKLPMNTVEAKKSLTNHLKCSDDKVWRLIREPYKPIKSDDLINILAFFQLHLPDTKLEDIVEPETNPV